MKNTGSAGSLALGDFWSWSASDLLVNTNRGLFAEFLVARALGDPSPVRDPWRPYDVETPEGVSVEVKSASYIQSWAQKEHSSISYRIAATRAWDARTGAWDEVPRRQADVYVFALLAHKDQKTLDPADVEQWQFHVLSTRVLDQGAGAARSIALSRLERLGAACVPYDQLSAAVRLAAARETG